MQLSFINHLFQRRGRRRFVRASTPHCVRCGRRFIASGLDASSRCWWCARSVDIEWEPDPYVDLGGGD